MMFRFLRAHKVTLAVVFFSTSRMHDHQPQMLFVAIEVAVIVQQFVVVFNAVSSYEIAYRLAYCDAFIRKRR